MTMPTDQIERIVDNTVAVLTTRADHRAEWREIVVEAVTTAQQGGAPWQAEAEFFAAILALLEAPASRGGPARPPSATPSLLPPDHPYAPALAAIMAGVVADAIADPGGPALSDEQVEFVAHRTAEVLTTDSAGRAEWQAALSGALAEAQEHGRADDAEFFTALLALLKPSAAEPTLPPGHNYAAALEMVQAMIAAGGPSQAAVSMETMRIVRNFLAAEDWPATRRVVEAHADVLLSPQMDALFEANIADCHAHGEDEAARLLEQHLVILRACRDKDIAAVFDLLADLEDE